MIPIMYSDIYRMKVGRTADNVDGMLIRMRPGLETDVKLTLLSIMEM